MNEPPPSDPDDFQNELETLRSILHENLHRAKQDPLLGTQLEFWLESAKFLELDIEIWDQAGNMHKENEAKDRMRRVLDVLQKLVDQMNKMNGDGGNDKF
jgi:hypothetical protein